MSNLLLVLLIMVPIAVACLPLWMRKIDNIVLLFIVGMVFAYFVNHDMALDRDMGIVAVFPSLFSVFFTMTTLAAIVIALSSPLRRVKPFKPYFYLNGVYYVLAIVGALCVLNFPSTRHAQVLLPNSISTLSTPIEQTVWVDKAGSQFSRLVFQFQSPEMGKTFCYLPNDAANSLINGQIYAIQKSTISRTCDQIKQDQQLVYGLLGYASYAVYWAVGLLLMGVGFMIRSWVSPYCPKKDWR